MSSDKTVEHVILLNQNRTRKTFIITIQVSKYIRQERPQQYCHRKKLLHTYLLISTRKSHQDRLSERYTDKETIEEISFNHTLDN